MKTHIVREAFSLDGVDYPRGTELTDAAVIEKARENHQGHLVPTSDEIPAPAPDQSKGKPSDAGA